MKRGKFLAMAALTALVFAAYGCPTTTGTVTQDEQTCYSMVDQENYQEAIYYCNAALRQNSSEKLYMYAALANMAGGRPEDGILLLDEGVQKYPKSQPLRKMLVISLTIIEQYDLAAQHLLVLLDQDPKNGEYYYMASELFYRSEMYDDALNALSLSSQYSPQCNGEYDQYYCGGIEYMTGKVYAAMGDNQKAADYYEQAAKINPDSKAFSDAYIEALIDDLDL